MSGGWPAALGRQPGARTAVDMIAEGMGGVDYMPASPPAAEPTVTIPARLFAAARAEMLADRDRARGENGLVAPAGSGTARRADAHEKYWRSLHPGFAEFLDWPFGGGS